MKYRTRVRVKECKAALPKFHGATGEVMWTTLPGLTVMLKLDKPIDPAPNCSGGYFHSIAIRALEVIE